MKTQQRIISDKNIMLGKPVIYGTRITVELILKKISEGATTEDLLSMYPQLNAEDFYACFTYAYNIVSREEVIELC